MIEKDCKFNVTVLGVSCFDGMASSTRVRNLVEPLMKTHVVTLNNIVYETDAHGLQPKKGVKDEIRFVVLEFKVGNFLSLIQFIRGGIRFIKLTKSATKKNVIYNYEYPDIKNIIFILYAKLLGYSIVLDIVEDFRYYKKFASSLNRFKIFSARFLIAFTPQIADGVMTISSHLHGYMRDKVKAKIPVYHVPISVNLRRFEIKEYKIPGNFKIFYGGSFGEKDGLECLISAFEIVCSKYDNVQLILTGRASLEDAKRTRGYLERVSCKGRIINKGFLPIDEYYQVLKDCDIFCVPRIDSDFANAGFPFKLGEFLSAGRAVIATRIGDIPKYLENNKNAILISPDSVMELAAAITCVIDNPERISSLGVEARKVAESNFDADAVSSKFLELLEKV